MDGLAADADVERLLPEPAAAAFVADRAAAEAAEHVFVLDLVAVGLDPLEEIVDAVERLFFRVGRDAFPDLVPDFLGEFAPGFEDGDAVAPGDFDEVVLEPAHLVAAPGRDRPVVDALGLVGDDQVLADADDLAQAAADGTGPERGIEAEEVFVGLAEGDAVQLEAVAEGAHFPVLDDVHRAPAGAERIGDGAEQAGARVGVGRLASEAEPVHEQV